MRSQTGANARIAQAVAALCLLAIPSGCAASPSAGPPDPVTETSTTPASASASEPTAAPLPGPPGGDAPPVAEAPVIRWIPLGPASPTDPPEGTLYELVRQRDCAGLRDTTLNTAFPSVWAAAEATCFALASDHPQDWQRAAASLASVADLPPERCWEATVAGSLRQVVEFRAAHPAVPLRLATEGVGDACPRRLTGLTVLDGPYAGTTTPAGPSAGGTRVQLEGFFVRVDSILVDGKPVDFEGPQFGPYVFTSPPSEGAASVPVTVEASPAVSGVATFFYEDSTPAAPAPTPTATEPSTPGAATLEPPTPEPPTPAPPAQGAAPPSAPGPL